MRFANFLVLGLELQGLFVWRTELVTPAVVHIDLLALVNRLVERLDGNTSDLAVVFAKCCIGRFRMIGKLSDAFDSEAGHGNAIVAAPINLDCRDEGARVTAVDARGLLDKVAQEATVRRNLCLWLVRFGREQGLACLGIATWEDHGGALLNGSIDSEPAGMADG